MTNLSSSWENFDLLPFWIASKRIFLGDENNFGYEPIPNNTEFTFMEKILKKLFCFFRKNSPYLLNEPRIYIHIHIYIYTYIYIYVINTKLCWEHKVPWISLAIHPNYLWFLAALLGCILCPHKVDVSLWWSINTVTLACSYAGVHKKTLLMSSYLLFQQCFACLVCLSWMVCKIRGRWPHSCCFMWCCFQDFFNVARSILM